MRAGRTALDGARQLFLIGAPRSGTTILANLLNAHRGVLLTHETAAFLQLDEMMKKSRLGSGGGVLSGKTYHDLWADHLREQAMSLIESFYGKIAQRENRGRLSYWGEKHPHLDRALPLLEALYPDSTYIYAVRDPRDTACSIAQMNSIAVNRALDMVCRFAGRYEAFVASIAAERVTVVRYEDLVGDYESVIGDVLKALGLTPDRSARAYLEKHKHRSSHSPDVRQRIDHAITSVARWRRDMTAAEQSYALTQCKALMLKYGYLDQP